MIRGGRLAGLSKEWQEHIDQCVWCRQQYRTLNHKYFICNNCQHISSRDQTIQICSVCAKTDLYYGSILDCDRVEYYRLGGAL